MKNILILGASGFIGKNIFEFLSSKKDDYNLITPNSRQLDCTNYIAVENFLKDKYFDVVINAVGHSNIPGKNRLPKDELKKTLAIFFNFERQKHRFGKMLYFGSGAEYDRQNYIPKMTEDYFDTFVPKDDYGYAKYLINKSIRTSNNIYNLRIFGLFGKYEYWPNKFISLACCKAISNIPISIRRDVSFDWLYIDDLMPIILYFIEENPLYKDYNICSGHVYFLSEISDKVVELAKNKVDIFICDKSIGKEYSGDNSRLLKEIKNFNFTPIEVSLKRLFDYYLSSKTINYYDIFYLHDKI